MTKADGSQVDVQLDKSFAVVGSKDDGDDGNEAGTRPPLRTRALRGQLGPG